ncbi:MAG: hypothetical protein KAW93_09165, partial [Methanogenium sp.]|nr:hypothetical protein [Methanogenium sp.]
HILSVPDEIKALTEDKIRAVAGLLQPSYCKITGTRAEVIAAFNQRYMSAEVLNWYCQREGTRFVSPKSTSGNPGIVILDNGRFYSHHNSDGLSEHSHSAFDALVEYGHNGNDEAGLAKACKLLKMGLKTPTKAAKEAKPATEPPTPPEIPEAVKQEAAEVLKSGHALDFMKTTFHLKHEGDDITAECLALLTACQSVSNATGLHLVLSGEKGEGKSHTVETWLKQIPCAYKLAGSFSDKTLFYRSIATPSIIYIDDRALSEDLNATIKTATSHYQEVTQHFTVSKDRQAVKLSLAARSAFVFSKVDDVGDDQLLDRCLSAWVDSDQVHSRRVTSLTLSRAAAPRNQSKEDNHNEQICQALWTKIKDCEFYVSVPFALRIHFEGFTYRNQGIFLDLIRCYAVLRHPDRNPITADDGVIEITALESDFTQAKDLFSKLMSHHGDQIQKLTPTEGVVIDHIKKHQITVFTISDIQNWIDVSTSQAHGIMNGRSDRGHHYGGLLAKCPAISVARVQSSYETEQKSRRAVTRNVYYVDSETLQRWSRHTQVWLEPLTTLQHACNTLTTRCVVSDSATNQQQPEKQRSYNNNNSHLQHKEKYVQQQGGGVETPPPPDNYTSSCYCNSGVLEEKEKNFISAPNEQNNPHASTNDLQHTVLQACCKQVVVLDAKYDNFTQADFHKLRKPDLQKCSLCGRSTVTYREHCTHENKKRAPARICDRCYAVLPLGGGIQEHLTIPTVSDFHKHSCDNVPCTQCNRICTQAGGAFTDGNTFLCGECLTQATKQNLVEKGVIV